MESGAGLAIRMLDENDAPVFRDVRLRALREDPTPFLASYEEDARLSAYDFAARLRSSDPATGVIGAFRGELLLGTLGFYRHGAAKAKHRVSLWGVYVVPEERRRHVGSALLREAVDRLRAVESVEQIELTVVTSARPAHRLYLAAGFQVQGRLGRATKVGDAYFDEEMLVMWLRRPPVEDRLDERKDAAGDAPRPLRPRDQPMVEQLASRSSSECVPLMLEIARRHAVRKRPAELMTQYGRDGFVAPSVLDQRLAHRLDGMVLQVAAEFDAVLLSPLAPLGSCAGVSPSNQDRIVSTSRGTEVVSDPTNVLAMECARRVTRGEKSSVRLCTVHQTVRAQRFKARAGHSQHFRLFALAEAGMALPDHGFEVEAVVQHVRLFWRLLDACEALGARFPNRRATLLVAAGARPIGTRVVVRLRETVPGLEVSEAPLDSAYYRGIRVLFGADGASGEHINIADTGLFDWVAKLTSNRRLRFVASGLGLQLLPLLFGSLNTAPVVPHPCMDQTAR